MKVGRKTTLEVQKQLKKKRHAMRGYRRRNFQKAMYYIPEFAYPIPPYIYCVSPTLLPLQFSYLLQNISAPMGISSVLV
jgi:hypothetical protein